MSEPRSSNAGKDKIAAGEKEAVRECEPRGTVIGSNYNRRWAGKSKKALGSKDRSGRQDG